MPKQYRQHFFAKLFCTLVGLLISFLPFSCLAMEFSGTAAVEGRLFLHSPQFAGQRSQDGSLAVSAELYHEFTNGSSLIMTPFARLDSADQERTHADLRELNYLHVGDKWEVRLGLGKVFWGACEFVHLVDIINQTDLVESLDGEDKIGQPLGHLSLVRDWGVVDAFYLPYFRERTFAGVHGRLRSSLVVDTDHPLYESGREERHQDVALRYSRSLGSLDVGLSTFQGTSREPFLLPALNKNGDPVLLPFYEQINQTAVDLQGVFGSWLVKAEALYRTGYGRDFFAATGGFEYTLVGIYDSAMDLGLIGEYVFDDREHDRATLFNNDLMAGLRLAFNDAASSQILLGLVQDLEYSSRLLTVEAGRRLHENVRLNLEVALFMDGATGSVDNALGDDDFIKLELLAYF
ncbi:MAG: hypothetical protein KKD73_13210 [Proteobacteria bacterium]|nr:hypothetical protein [Pseudomonadota bacterium]MBU1640193.1 hypothetical protein [Pseudomonadota bacterium]